MRPSGARPIATPPAANPVSSISTGVRGRSTRRPLRRRRRCFLRGGRSGATSSMSGPISSVIHRWYGPRSCERERRTGAGPDSIGGEEAAMTHTPLRDIVRGVVSIPTAPYLEGGVREYIRSFAEARGLAHEEDAFGNAYVTYRRGRRRRPLVLGAHMDHPALVVTGIEGDRLDLEFRGGIAASYGDGEPLVLYREGAHEPHARAVVTSVRADERGRLAGCGGHGRRGRERRRHRGPRAVGCDAVPVPRRDRAGARLRRPRGSRGHPRHARPHRRGAPERPRRRAVHARRGGRAAGRLGRGARATATGGRARGGRRDLLDGRGARRAGGRPDRAPRRRDARLLAAHVAVDDRARR